MSPSAWLANLTAYSLQVAALVSAGVLAPLSLRLRDPRARLACWQILLAGCLLLPAVQPWRRPVLPAPARFSPGVATAAGVEPAPGSVFAVSADAVLLVLGLGFAARSFWLLLGFLRLHRYRRDAEEMSPVVAAVEQARIWTGARARIYVSSSIASPLTFGVFRPAVLFPTQFLEMTPQAQQAIACHEFLHVRRCDWAFTVVEESIRCLLWFHPAIWWLLGRIHLAREQTVDHEVTLLTENRDQYIEALLAIASGNPQPDLAPAPLFLRKRHLAQRVASLVKEIPMSKRRMIVSLIAIIGALWITGRMAVSAFPLQAPPRPQKSVSVEGGEANLLHRPPIQYPREALEKRIEGAVVLELSVNDSGLVSDARVLSGPEELRSAALQSVLQWHYSKDRPLPARFPATIQFRLPEPEPVPAPKPSMTPARAGVPKLHPAPVIKLIQMEGVPPAVREGLRDRLPVREGDVLDAEAIEAIHRAVTETDKHLLVGYQDSPEGTAVSISLAPPRITAPKLLTKVEPEYSEEARTAGLQGTVELYIEVGTDGRAHDTRVRRSLGKGLDEQAMDAVRRWLFEPGVRDGEPVTVGALVTVHASRRNS